MHRETTATSWAIARGRIPRRTDKTWESVSGGRPREGGSAGGSRPPYLMMVQYEGKVDGRPLAYGSGETPDGWSLQNCHCAAMSAAGAAQWPPPWLQSTTNPPGGELDAALLATSMSSVALAVADEMTTLSDVPPWVVRCDGTCALS